MNSRVVRFDRDGGLVDTQRLTVVVKARILTNSAAARWRARLTDTLLGAPVVTRDVPVSPSFYGTGGCGRCSGSVCP